VPGAEQGFHGLEVGDPAGVERVFLKRWRLIEVKQADYFLIVNYRLSP
jgi:hypothetical protein